jgi:hypothetical protein
MNAGLGSCVSSTAWRRMECAHASDADDGPAVWLTFHKSKRPLAAVQDTGEIDGNYGGEQPRRSCGARDVGRSTGVIDQDIKTPVMVFDSREQRIELICLANIAPKAKSGGFSSVDVIVPAACNDRGASARKGANYGGTDAAASTSDQHDLASQCLVHRKVRWDTLDSNEWAKEFKT